MGQKKLGEGLAKFHAGGSERMEKLKHMFKVIKDNDIPVTIMSANRAIITVPDIYITILKEWGCESATLYHAEPGKKYSQIHKIGKLV